MFADSRLSRVANIRVQDDVSSAYDKIIRQLEEHRREGGHVWDERLPLQTSNLPQHVQLLVRPNYWENVMSFSLIPARASSAD